MLEYKAKLDEEKENRPYCNHQEFSKLIQKEELSKNDHLKYVKLFLDVSHVFKDFNRLLT